VVIIATMASAVGMAAMRIWPAQAVLQRIDLLAHGARVTDDAAGPVEHPLALGSEALEARAPLHQEHAEHILELLDAGREGGLAYAASLGRVAEMPLARERNDEFELVEHEDASSASCHFRKNAGQGPEAWRQWPCSICIPGSRLLSRLAANTTQRPTTVSMPMLSARALLALLASGPANAGVRRKRLTAAIAINTANKTAFNSNTAP
jgi:hypothetical protein